MEKAGLALQTYKAHLLQVLPLIRVGEGPTVLPISSGYWHCPRAWCLTSGDQVEQVAVRESNRKAPHPLVSPRRGSLCGHSGFQRGRYWALYFNGHTIVRKPSVLKGGKKKKKQIFLN